MYTYSCIIIQVEKVHKPRQTKTIFCHSQRKEKKTYVPIYCLKNKLKLKITGLKHYAT